MIRGLKTLEIQPSIYTPRELATSAVNGADAGVAADVVPRAIDEPGTYGVPFTRKYLG